MDNVYNLLLFSLSFRFWNNPPVHRCHEPMVRVHWSWYSCRKFIFHQGCIQCKVWKIGFSCERNSGELVLITILIEVQFHTPAALRSANREADVKKMHSKQKWDNIIRRADDMLSVTFKSKHCIWSSSPYFDRSGKRISARVLAVFDKTTIRQFRIWQRQ